MKPAAKYPKSKVVRQSKSSDGTYRLFLACGHETSSGSEKFGRPGQEVDCVACYIEKKN